MLKLRSNSNLYFLPQTKQNYARNAYASDVLSVFLVCLGFFYAFSSRLFQELKSIDVLKTERTDRLVFGDFMIDGLDFDNNTLS